MDNVVDGQVVKKTAEEFAQAYKKLCDEYGFRINVVPQFVSTNHGSFEIVLNASITEIPKEETKEEK